jgi:Arc/MetJ-type ribon-helix-helix transcriptional regulator
MEGTMTMTMHVRLDDDLVDGIDRLAKLLEAERPGQRVTRSDVLRIAVTELMRQRAAASAAQTDEQKEAQ